MILVKSALFEGASVIYLGIHNSVESGAALVIDGKVIGAVQEERFTREKNCAGWPRHSVEYLLNLAGLDIHGVDAVVYGMLEGIEPNAEVSRALQERIAAGRAESPELAGKFDERLQSEIAWNARHTDEFLSKLRELGAEKKLKRIDHHCSHAASAYYGSGFDEALIFTCDGKGGFKSNSVWSGRNGRIQQRDFRTTFDSAGYFYGNITRALGFKSERHEGKITGLAAYGNASVFRHVTDEMLCLRNGELYGKLGDYYLPWFCDRSTLPKLFEEVEKAGREDVAAAAQATLEEVVCGWVQKSLERYAPRGKRHLALAGGVFANVKLNQRIREIDDVSDVYVFPAMGDGGIPLGGIFAQMAEDGNPFQGPLESVYLGPSFTQSQAEETLSKRGCSFTRPASPARILKELFDAGKPVGFFQGRMEYGPRALCNRSILYHAKDPSVNDWLNTKLNRSEFMPFAPVTTAELAPRCFKDWKPSDPAADFMTMTYDCSDEFCRSAPASIHVDGTARPQVVRRERNPGFHALLSDYLESSGELAIINTSFNNHEEPIVCTIDDAVDSFLHGNVDALLVEGLLTVRS